MGRKTKQNKITSPELIAQINPKNIRLMNDFLEYLRSIGKQNPQLKHIRAICISSLCGRFKMRTTSISRKSVSATSSRIRIGYYGTMRTLPPVYAG